VLPALLDLGDDVVTVVSIDHGLDRSAQSIVEG
jgi:hypothetical protein